MIIIHCESSGEFHQSQIRTQLYEWRHGLMDSWCSQDAVINNALNQYFFGATISGEIKTVNT